METEQEEVIPRNIRDKIKKQIEDWEKKDKMFVPTRASDYVMECLQDKGCVILTAPSGVGKSFISRHTALILQKEGYNIIPVELPSDIKTYYQPGKQTVFIVDNICGNFTVNQLQVENWKQLLPVIYTIIADKCCKIIVSCRLQVYKDDKFDIEFPLKFCECNLVSDKLCLTSVEKNIIAKTYIGTSVDDMDDLSQNSEFFPLLCSLYHGGKNGDVKEFFKNPFNVFQNKLDNLSRHGDGGNYEICSLALCVLSNNHLKEKWFQGKVTDEQQHIIKDICDAFEINRSTSKTKLKKALDTLDGTFICEQNGMYRTVHDKLFDFLAHYFGQKMIECLIDHGDYGLVHERFIWQKSQADKNSYTYFVIEIPDDYLESYFKRFIKEWSAGNVRIIFINTNMTVLLFRQQLLRHLKQLDKSQQVTLVNTKDTVLPTEHIESGTTSLIMTCQNGYTGMVQWMLHNDVDVDQCRGDGVNGLYMASQKGHTDIVKLLLEKSPNVDLCDKKFGFSPLYMASKSGYTDIVKLLLEKSPNVDLCEKKFGFSPLYMASQSGYTDIVKLLLEKNPNVDLCNKIGCSPLFIASLTGHTDIVKLLLEMNPNVDLCENVYGLSPLYMASKRGHTNIVKLLLEKNPNVDLCDKDGFSALHWAILKDYTNIVKLLLEKSPNVDLCDRYGYSTLHRACQQPKHTNIVKLLLEKNPNVDLYTNNGLTTLYMASEEGYTDIVKLLLEKSPNIDLCNSDGCSPLYIASQKGHTDIVKLLLEKSPNIDLCNNDGCSALYIVSQKGHTDIVKLLLEKCPNVDLCNNDGCSPLYIASQKGHTDIVKLLLEKSPNIDLCNNDGCSPLYIASQKGHTDIVKLLLEKCPNVDLCDKDGWSPLFVASQQRHTDIVKLLLQKSPDVDLCNKDGWSPLFVASQQRHTDIVKLLLEKNPNVDICEQGYGLTPLILSCISNNTSVLQLLIKHKANINAQTIDGSNSLYFSALNGHIEITKILLENYADCNMCIYSKQYITDTFTNHEQKTLDKGKQILLDSLVENTSSHVTDYVSKKSVDYAFDVVAGSSPLHIACFMGRTDVVCCLLDHNANINMQKEDGTTPLFYACEVGHEDIVRLLLDKGAVTEVCRLDGKSPLDIATDNGHTSIVVTVTEHMKKEETLVL